SESPPDKLQKIVKLLLKLVERKTKRLEEKSRCERDDLTSAEASRGWFASARTLSFQIVCLTTCRRRRPQYSPGYLFPRTPTQALLARHLFERFFVCRRLLFIFGRPPGCCCARPLRLRRGFAQSWS